MKFDKSKVCVAGLHDVPVGTKGYYSDSLKKLEEYVTTEEEGMFDECVGFDNNKVKYEIISPCWRWQFFYPLPEKQYRPFETIEEMYSLLGKVIVERDGTKRCIITVVEKWCNNLYIDSMNVLRAFNDYTMEDGSPVGVEV